MNIVVLQVIASFGLGHKHHYSGKHLYQEDILDPKKYLEKIFEYYVADDRANFTRWFFSAENSDLPARRPTYIFQNKERSQLFSQAPHIYSNLEGIPVDFYNKEDDKLDPYNELYIQEDKLVRENPQEVSKEALWLNIRSVFSQPRPENNEKVGTYIYRKLGRMGLVLYLQTFQYISRKNSYETLQKASGVNLVSVLPGFHWKTPSDKILVVGTNWDLKGDKEGDHGSGIAALLEVARVLMADESYKPEFSVIFVAFDKKAEGCVGSKKFITEYLKPLIIEEYGSSVQGMYNIDTIFGYSNTNNSQMLPKIYYENNPEVYNDIQATGGKGNFLAVLSRGTEEELRLTSTLNKNMVSEGILQKDFKFPHLNSSPNIINYLAKYTEIWNSDSGRFWFTDESNSFPSVTLTDTGIHRRAISHCRSSVCKIQQKRSNFLKRVLFLEAVTKSLVKTIKELSKPVKKSVTKTNTYSEKLSETARLYNMLSSFLRSLTDWQYRIENKISNLTKHIKHSSEINNQFQTNSVNLVYEYKNESNIIEKNSKLPYFVIGDKSTNIPTLNNVIERYYGPKTTNGNVQNSPMIVKVVT